MQQKSDTNNNNLIHLKNGGSLIYPSSDLVYICKMVEKTLHTYMYNTKTLSHFNMNMFTYAVMEKFIGTSIFNELKEHINDQCVYSNHVNHLLRAIIQIYS